MKKHVVLVALVTGLLAEQTGARYLIITHPDYVEALKPLAEWKTQKGYKAKIVTTDETGTDSTEIRAYVVHAYNTWDIRPEYLLLVGNGWQIPFPYLVYYTYGVSTDAYYGNVVGDFHNDIIPGRFWSYDTLDVQTMVSKVLGYERTPYLEDSLWFRKGVTIVNEYEPGQPSSDSLYWADARYAHFLMNSAGFVHIDSFSYNYGNDHVDVMNAWNDGRTYMLYRGLGMVLWSWPFMEINVNALNNGFKLPIIISATCATIEGIGYEWTNAGTQNEPKGAVGFFGTTTALFAAGELRSALTRGTLTSIFADSLTTLGRAAEAGRLQYVSEFGDLLEYYSWNILGDPEMTLWTTTPQAIEVTHNTFLHTGLCTLSVHVQKDGTPLENALACVRAKRDTICYHWGRTDSAGRIAFVDTLHMPGDSIYFTVTGRNLLPYNGCVRVTYTGGPYVILNSFSLSDAAGGNNDSLVNPGENIEVPLWLKNWGDTAAYGVFAVIDTSQPDPYVILHDTLKYFGTIAAFDSAFTSTDGYNATIANNCPDLHYVTLQLTMTDTNAATWVSDLGFTVHAPVLNVTDYYFDPYGRSFPAGDTGLLVVELTNTGSYYADNVFSQLICNDPYVTILDAHTAFEDIAADGGTAANYYDPFRVLSHPETPVGHPVDFTLILTSGVYIDTIVVTGYVGKKDFLVWDPDANHTSGPVIKAHLDSLLYNGDYVTEFPNDLLTLYKTVFICAGVYPNNHVIYDTSTAAREIEDYLCDYDGMVYLEGGDVWCGDPQSQHGYNFCPLFHIRPVSNTIGLFPSVEGCSGQFTADMYFPYHGETTMIDNIDANPGGGLIFCNTRNGYGCGVAANRTTIGLSFELGGLTDTLSSTTLALVDSIMNYFDIPPTCIQERRAFDRRTEPFLAIHPNPAFRRVEICYGGISPTEHMTVHVYDISGRSVIAFDFQPYSRSSEQVYWNGTDEAGRRVPQGIYFVQVKTDAYTDIEKVVLLQ
jgi:hypothetical protein